MRVGTSAQHILAVNNLVQILSPVLDPVSDEFAADFLSNIRYSGPGDVDRGGVERSSSDCGWSNLR